ncbi:MAG: class I SAM-dependent methyltransferase [Candidatus Latescibacteria bacterium]|nr:class I SAM-dependent methyltransferase [Candidatus Latescibacterota bacterium]
MSDKLNGFNDYKSIRNKPYVELAEIYDRVMDHVDYAAWAEYIFSVFQRFEIGTSKACHSPNVLEIACGTGNLSVNLHKLGFSLTCTDISPSMIAMAAHKFKKYNLPHRLFSSNMKSIPLNCLFDAVLCIYDSINYMVTSEDFIQAVREVASVTEDGGFFIFDVCTEKNSEKYFSQSVMDENFGDIQYERVCNFNHAERIQKNHFIIHKNGKRHAENHYQKIFKLHEITEMIKKTPFTIRGRFDDLTFNPGTENSERIHFVLQKTEIDYSAQYQRSEG